MGDGLDADLAALPAATDEEQSDGSSTAPESAPAAQSPTETSNVWVIVAGLLGGVMSCALAAGVFILLRKRRASADGSPIREVSLPLVFHLHYCCQIECLEWCAKQFSVGTMASLQHGCTTERHQCSLSKHFQLHLQASKCSLAQESSLGNAAAVSGACNKHSASAHAVSTTTIPSLSGGLQVIGTGAGAVGQATALGQTCALVRVATRDSVSHYGTQAAALQASPSPSAPLQASSRCSLHKRLSKFTFVTALNCSFLTWTSFQKTTFRNSCECCTSFGSLV